MSMSGLNVRRKVSSAVAEALAAGTAEAPPSAGSSAKNPSAAAMMEPTVPAWSPIVVAGIVRMTEFALIAAVGSQSTWPMLSPLKASNGVMSGP